VRGAASGSGAPAYSAGGPARSSKVRPVEGRELRCIWAGVAGSALVVAGGVVVGPAAAPHASGARAAGLVATYAGIAVLVGAWLHLGRLLAAGRASSSRRLVLLALVAWGLPLLCGPVLFSRDLFAYAAQGREVVSGINPYQHGPAALGGGPYLRFVSHMWWNAPSPYGPFFLGLDRLIVGEAGGHVMAAVVVLRLLAAGGVVLVAAAVAWLAPACGVEPAEALWLGVLNPLVLLHILSGGHNEGLMLGLLLAGLALARQRHFAAGLVLCLLAAAVKIPASLGVIYVAADWVAAAPDGAARAWAALRATATAAVTAVVMTVWAGLGWGWVRALTTPARIRSSLAPVTDLGQLVGKVMTRIHASYPASQAVSTARFAGLTAAVVTAGVLFAGRIRRPSAAGIGLSLLALAVLGPVLHPWYLLWGLVPLAAAGAGRLRPLLIWASAGMSLLVLPDGRPAPGVMALAFLIGTALVGIASLRSGAEPPVRGVVPA